MVERGISEQNQTEQSVKNARVHESLEFAVVDLLRLHGLTVTCAESCTGGLLSGRLVDVPGVSDVYRAGVVTYANEAKQKFLGVKKSTLEKYGAVSEQTAEEMAIGAIAFADADVSVAVTGIAGPDGGTPEKPVGLVYIACCVKGKTVVRKCLFDSSYHGVKGRREVRETTVETALSFLLDCLIENYGM